MHLLIELNDMLMMICFNDEHLTKTFSPIEITVDGIVIYSNDEHPEKALSPIDLIEDGMVI